VRYWGLGNEMYGPWQIGALSAEDYVKQARQFAKVMSWTDPSIELVACGENGLSDWDRVVVEGLADKVRWHSIHIYTGTDDYWSNVLSPHQAERALRRVSSLIENTRYCHKIAHPIHVAYDEWNVWFRERENGLEERYTLADALAVATYLHAFLRHCRAVRMANLAQLVNVIAPIVTRPDGLFLQTIYHPLRLFADHLRPVALDVHVDCDTHELDEVHLAGGWPHRVADLGPFGVLDVTAMAGERNEGLTVSVINRSPTDTVEAKIALADAIDAKPATLERVTGPDPAATNSFEQPDRVTVEKEALNDFGDGTVIQFPPHSHTVISTGEEARP
jgi:alpha-L-arabinofuranosidase